MVISGAPEGVAHHQVRRRLRSSTARAVPTDPSLATWDESPYCAFNKMDAVTLLLIATLPTGIRHEVPLGEFGSMAKCMKAKATAESATRQQSAPGVRRTLYCVERWKRSRRSDQ